MIRILFLGDIVGEPGRRAVFSRLESLKQEEEIDFIRGLRDPHLEWRRLAWRLNQPRPSPDCRHSTEPCPYQLEPFSRSFLFPCSLFVKKKEKYLSIHPSILSSRLTKQKKKGASSLTNIHPGLTFAFFYLFTCSVNYTCLLSF